jgi:hypothetical protein
MADVVGKAKIVAELDNKQALDNLEKYRRRLMETGRSYDKLFKEDISRKFSENFRKGFEQGVLRGLEKGENQFYQMNRAIGVAASSLEKIKAPAQMAADGFMKLQRTGLKFQAVAGTISGSIGDLVGGFYSLVGVVGAAAPALTALGSTMIGVGIGFVGVKIAMAGVSNAISTVWQSQTALNDTFRAARQEYIGLKFAAEEAALSQEGAALKLESAREALARVQDLPPDNRLRRQTELAFKQADLQLREAKHKSEESFRAVKKGIEATNAYQPLAPLTAVQLQFVKFMVALRPQMQQLKKEVAEGFIPKLQESIQILMKYGFPVLKVGLKKVASAMGDAAKVFASAFKDNGNLANLSSLFDSSSKTIGHFGNSIKSAFGGFLSLLHAAEPLTEKFAAWVDKTLGNFAKNSRIKDFNGDLDRTFQLAGNVAARLGNVFKGIFDGVKNIIKAAFPSGARSGGGGVLLDFLDSITKSFKKFTSDKGFADWLQNTTTGAVEALKTVGKFLAIFTDLAGSKETKEFWIILRDAIPYVKTILENGQKAGKELAGVLVKFVKIISSVADAGAVITFFGTLNNILGVFANVLSSPAFQFFIDIIGKIHGPILALGAVALIAVKAFKIFLGYVMNMFSGLAKFSANMKSAERSFVSWRNEAKLASQAGLNFWQRLGQVSKAARDSRLLQLSRDAGVAKDRLAQLELQMLSNSRAATLYNEKTKASIEYLNMNEAEALEMAVRYERLALEAGMAAKEVQVLNATLLNNIQAANGGAISNQGLLAGTSLSGGQYRAPYVAGGGGGPAGGGGIVPAAGTGKSGLLRSVGGLFKGANKGVGMGGIAGGIGMTATVGASLFGMSSGVTSETGMVIQSLAGVASMFGPTGMVVGGLLSIGSVIADSINAAAAEEVFKIKTINIDSATISAKNLNQNADFAAEAVVKGISTDLQGMKDLASNIELQSTAYLTQKEQGNLSSIATIKNSSDLKDASLQVGLASKRGLQFLQSTTLQPKIQQAALSLGNTGRFNAEQIGSSIGGIAGITKSTQAAVLEDIKSTMGAGYSDALKDFKFEYNDSGQLTTKSFTDILTKFSMVGQTPFIPTNKANNVLGLKPYGANRTGIPGVTPMAATPVYNPLEKYKVGGGSLAGIDTDKFQNYLMKGGASAGKVITADKEGVFTGIAAGKAQDAVNAVQGVSLALTGIKGPITEFAGALTNGVGYDGKQAGYLAEGTYTAAQIEKLKSDYELYYNNLPESKKLGSKKNFVDMFGKDQLVKNDKGGYTVQNTGQAAGMYLGNFTKGYNVSGQVFTLADLKNTLSKIDTGSKDSSGKAITLDTLITEGKLDNLVDLSVATGLTNPIIQAANDNAIIQTDAMKTSSQAQKDSAAQMGIAAAKIEGFGKLVADNANRAIAFAVLQATAEGKKAITAGDTNKINSLLIAEMKKLGLPTG